MTEAALTKPGPFVPSRYRVVDRKTETFDITTLWLEPVDQPIDAFKAGQFNMLTVFGVGEIAISISSAPGAPGAIEHTVRDVGAVSHALSQSAVGDVVGVRGPFGTDWGLASLDGVDVVVVAGGIGLAPLRGAMRYLAENKSPERTVALRVGARLPDQIVFPDEIARWGEMGIDVAVTVDVADAGWTGHVGVVTQILAELPFDGAGAVALVCGPEIMMRFSARSLIDLGVTPENIRVSLERNMQCGIAMCGHCQLGPYLLCRDGPVVPYAPLAAELITESER
ncbi:MAG: FAD/NAD(P)-binding protein [Acidimicrobiales bacterium]